MNHPAQIAVDLEEATDQLLDEICQRPSTIYALVNRSLDENGPPVDEIRQHAATLIDRRITVNPIARA